MATAELEPRSAWLFPSASDEEPTGHLSPSQVLQMVNCGLCYEAERVLRVPKAASVHFAIGGCAHRAAERIGRLILEGKEPQAGDYTEALQAGVQDYEERVSLPIDDESGVELSIELGKKFTSLDQAKDEAARITEFGLPELAKLYRARNLIAVEWDLKHLPAEIKAMALPFPFEGRIDAAFGNAAGEVTMISDLKTSAKMELPSANNCLQLACYGWFWHVAGQAVGLWGDILAKTIKPQFQSFPVGDPDGDGKVSPSQYAFTYRTIMNAAEDISAGRFRLGFGWNGKHDYDHGDPRSYHPVSGFDAA